MEKERIEFCINRFDHYYDSVNNKSAVFLAMGTFIVGGLTASIPYLLENVNYSILLYVFLSVSILFALASLVIVLYASSPFRPKGSSSLFYFNSIAKMDMKAFLIESERCSKDEEIRDLRQQVFFLAKGLSKKFKLLKYAGIFYVIVVLNMIPIIILIFKNLK
ncbi:DUF5706 domain-containing protein [Marinilabiliaceae bacterium ANBcel2]|nr:DUF5706 domain-containing protein [Marinilabiliaceae bacterium ANBcel2]